MGFLKTCCCGCTLRTGTLIIGALSLTFTTLYLIAIIAMIPLVQRATEALDREMRQKSDGATYTFGTKSDMRLDTNNMFETDMTVNNDNTSPIVFDMKSYTIELLSLCAVAASVTVLTSILLLIGAAKGYMWLLVPWIANVSLGVIGGVVSYIFNITRFSNLLSGGQIFLSVLAIFGGLALQCYLLMVVISHFEELRRNKRDPGTNLGKIYSAPSPWANSTSQILPNVPEKEGV